MNNLSEEELEFIRKTKEKVENMNLFKQSNWTEEEKEYLLNSDKNFTEIAKELNIPREEVVFALDAIQDPVSLFEPIYHDGGDAIYVMDQISDSKNSDDSWLENISIKEAMKKLNDREKLILTLRFFNGRTQMEVADEIGISQAQVSRLEKTALKHMRKYV